jgi:hypothetical protein
MSNDILNDPNDPNVSNDSNDSNVRAYNLREVPP